MPRSARASGIDPVFAWLRSWSLALARAQQVHAYNNCLLALLRRSRPKALLAFIVLLPMELLAAGPDGELVPIEKTLAPAQSTTTAPGPLDTITNLFGGDAPLLSPDEAFQFSVAPADGDTLMARWLVADGYYLYRDKMRLALKDTPGVSLGAISLPAGEIKQDEFFGRVQIYRQDVEVLLPLARTGGGAKTITVQARYQGCAEAGVCFPPITRQASLELPAYAVRDVNSRTRSLYTRNLSGARLGAKPYRSDQDRFAQLLTSQPLWFSALAFFGAGLLLTFTPCVFPMIPILSGIIAGQGQRIDARKAFVLSLTFVMAMAVTYTVAGVIVGLSGENVQAWFQNPWVIFVFALIFVLLALSMFGFYELQMPTAVQSRLSELSRRQEGGTFIGAGIMGVLSALIVGPCVTAPLIGALLVIAYTGDALLGGTALFALALGMGAPLLVIGTYEGKLMPRAGPWMETIKAIFGVLLLGLAIWLLGRVLPSATSMALWALLLIVSGIYMGAFDSIRQGASGWFRLWKGLGLAMSIYGALLLVGASGGGDDVLQPLKGVLVARGDAQDQEGLRFRQIKGPDELRRAIASANKRGKPVMLDFYADWCVSCKEMERYTFSDERVQAALSEAVLLQADVTANDVQDRALLRSLNLFGPPAILFYTPTGHERHDWRVVGYMPAERFHRHVRQALGTASSAS